MKNAYWNFVIRIAAGVVLGKDVVEIDSIIQRKIVQELFLWKINHCCVSVVEYTIYCISQEWKLV